MVVGYWVCLLCITSHTGNVEWREVVLTEKGRTWFLVKTVGGRDKKDALDVKRSTLWVSVHYGGMQCLAAVWIEELS